MIDSALVDKWETVSERSKADPDFSFLAATREIWRQAEAIVRGGARAAYKGADLG